MAAPGGTVAPDDATAFVTRGAAAVVVDTSVVARCLLAVGDGRRVKRDGASVKRGIEPLTKLAAGRGKLMPPGRHVVLDLPVRGDVTVRHVDVV